MKATTLIKNTIESRLGFTENDYKVLHMARIYIEGYDVAIIVENSTNRAYIIRAWKIGGSCIRRIKGNETYEEVFYSFLTLNE